MERIFRQYTILKYRVAAVCMMFVGVTMVVPAQYLCHGVWDNWSAGLQCGAASPLAHHAMLNDARTVIGWQIGKQVTPIFGLEFQSTLGLNTSGVHSPGSSNAVDDIHSSVLARLSLTNMVYGYVEQRFFEMEAVYGFGHQHHYYPASQADDREHFTSTAGMNFHFRLGQEKAFGVSLRPHVVWNLERQAYSASHAQLRLTLGLTYYFKSSNGKHYITRARLYDQPYIDALNAKVNDLRKMVKERDAALKRLKGE